GPRRPPRRGVVRQDDLDADAVRPRPQPRRAHPARAVRALVVVPAKAGTHNHRLWLVCTLVVAFLLQQHLLGRMGPGLRRDDTLESLPVAPSRNHSLTGGAIWLTVRVPVRYAPWAGPCIASTSTSCGF